MTKTIYLEPPKSVLGLPGSICRFQMSKRYIEMNNVKAPFVDFKC